MTLETCCGSEPVKNEDSPKGPVVRVTDQETDGTYDPTSKPFSTKVTSKRSGLFLRCLSSHVCDHSYSPETRPPPESETDQNENGRKRLTKIETGRTTLKNGKYRENRPLSRNDQNGFDEEFFVIRFQNSEHMKKKRISTFSF